jgi:hypothetical protein
MQMHVWVVSPWQTHLHSQSHAAQLPLFPARSAQLCCADSWGPRSSALPPCGPHCQCLLACSHVTCSAVVWTLLAS